MLYLFDFLDSRMVHYLSSGFYLHSCRVMLSLSNLNNVDTSLPQTVEHVDCRGWESYRSGIYRGYIKGIRTVPLVLLTSVN